jgi:hypothetical protein
VVNRKVTMPVLLMTAISLASCNESVWSKSPNLIGSAIVERIDKTTGSGWAMYDVKLTESDPAELRFVKVSGSRIVNSDIAPSIGKRVAIKCYREVPGGPCYASSYSYGGRELIVQAK